MNADHDEVRLMLGAYLLGGLAGSDRATVEEHLTGCPACRAEMSSLAAIPGLLRRRPADPAPAADPATGPGPELLPRLLSAVRDERRQRRRRVITRSVAAAAVTLVAATGTVAVTRTTADRGDARLVVVASSGYATHGGARLDARAWGTSVSLSLTGMPAADSFVLQVSDDSGEAEQAGSWGSTPSGKAEVTGATSMPLDHIVALRVLDAAGRVVATADRSR
ncbi:MAG: zf-HC2 domain-containing protein [Actinobacteria bacterium]|nr:zf-HC2 domain-containing protein [Actinomycetota bacterium]MBI3688807.1 zf-HC2 domain-containing protein [Actinomycetota bacterium]